MTEIRRARPQQGNLIQGARALVGRMGGAMEDLGNRVRENVRGNQERSTQERTRQQRQERQTGSVAARTYLRGDGRNSNAVNRVADTAEYMRSTGGLPTPRPMTDAQTYVNEANASDARARNDAVSERNPEGNGAQMTRGQGPNQRGVLQRAFTVNVDGQSVPISDEQRISLAQYTRENPRAFPTFADWFNAISTLDDIQPEQLTAEQIAAARRVWTQPASTDPRNEQGQQMEIRTIVDPATGRVTGYEETGAIRQNTANWEQGSGPTDATFAPPSADFTPEELTTAQSELMRIVGRNQRTSIANRSRALQQRNGGNPSADQQQRALNLPAEIAGAVIARSRLQRDVADLRSRQEERPITRSERDRKSMDKPGDDKPDGGKQTIAGSRGTLMTARDVNAEQIAQQRAAVDGVQLEERDPFTRERILPVRPPAESESVGDRASEAGTIRRGRWRAQPEGQGVRVTRTFN